MVFFFFFFFFFGCRCVGVTKENCILCVEWVSGRGNILLTTSGTGRFLAHVGRCDLIELEYR